MTLFTLTDSNFSGTIKGKATLILLTTGNDKLRGDFKTAFVKAADEEAGIVFAQVDPGANRGLSGQFDYQNKSLLIGVYRGEVLLRRSRPWASDLPGFIRTMQEAGGSRRQTWLRLMRRRSKTGTSLRKRKARRYWTSP